MDKNAEISRDQVVDNLRRAAWKLQGVAGLFNCQGDDGRLLEPSESNGVQFLLESIAEDILKHTESLEVTA